VTPQAADGRWRPSSPPADGSGRPGFWRPIGGVGNVSVRQCRASGYGEPSWTAALNGELYIDPSNGRPYFFTTCEEAQEAILAVAQALIPG
jgi:hypothetical protein